MTDDDETTETELPVRCPRCTGMFALGECTCRKDEVAEDEDDE